MFFAAIFTFYTEYNSESLNLSPVGQKSLPVGPVLMDYCEQIFAGKTPSPIIHRLHKEDLEEECPYKPANHSYVECSAHSIISRASWRHCVNIIPWKTCTGGHWLRHCP